MSDAEKIAQLKTELEQLYKDVKAQEQKIVSLHQQLQQLGGKEKETLFKTPKTKGAPQWSLENFIGLRLIHFVGIVVLVIGLSISVKYAIDRNLISEGLRVALAYAAGGLMLFFAWRLKREYKGFSALLFSGAMASFYFTTYAAFVYYGMFPSAAAFGIMVALTMLTVYQALSYNRQEIAILGLVGAYAIPFLISSNADKALLFFTYIAIINGAVVFLSYKKEWKLVGYLAQNITWLLLIGWAAQRGGEGQNWVGIFFAALFFLLFCGNALLPKIVNGTSFTKRQSQDILINNIALFVVAFLLYAADFSTVKTANISLVFSFFMALQAALFYALYKEEAYTKKMLAQLALVLLLLFIGARWDGIIVTLLWLVVAVGLFGWGVGSKAVWLRLAGVVLMGVTLAKLVLFDSMRFTPVQKIMAYLTLGVLLLLVGFFYQKFKEKLFGMDKEL